jgi:lipoprotein-releasing system ATP-binding protein
MSNCVLELKNIKRHFSQGTETLHVLKGVNLQVREGEVVALVGHSGTGKSTLLHIAGLLESPSSGEVIIGGEVANTRTDQTRTLLRRQAIGFVYQFHHLLPEFTALENIMLPQMIAGVPTKEAETAALKLLSTLKLESRSSHVPAKLSGGEQQRVAFLRALSNKPKILLADEPTGNLDEQTADHVFNELMAVVRGSKMAALIATHNMDLARRMDRMVTLRGGVLEVLE